MPGNEGLFAVIELGTTSIKMVVAESDGQTGFRVIDSLQQAVLLGRDTFTRAIIGQETIEECVKALRGYRKTLTEYGLSDHGRILAVATSAIREATNRDEVLDRIFVATGLNVEILEDAEITRYTYLAVYKSLKKSGLINQANLLIMEMGGGSTDVLTLRKGSVANSEVFKAGSYRIRRAIEDYNIPESRIKQVMRGHVDRAAGGIHMGIGDISNPFLVVLGGDARFAASIIMPEWDKKEIVKIGVVDVEKLVNDIIKLQPDDIVKKYHMSYPAYAAGSM